MRKLTDTEKAAATIVAQSINTLEPRLVRGNPAEAVRALAREIAPRIAREVDEEACDHMAAYCAEPVTPREP